jgi:hypothetical protein
MNPMTASMIANKIDVEKILLAIVIIICVVLFAVGLSKLFSGNYSNGFLLFLLGAGGLAGSVYWAKNPMKIGGHDGGCDDIVDYTGGDCGEMCDGGDELIVDYTGGCVDEMTGGCGDGAAGGDGDVEGGHESALLDQLQRLSNLFCDDVDEIVSSEIKDALKTAEESSSRDFSTIEKLLHNIHESAHSCTNPQSVMPILQQIKHLAESSGDKSLMVCTKIDHICDALGKSNSEHSSVAILADE